MALSNRAKWIFIAIVVYMSGLSSVHASHKKSQIDCKTILSEKWYAALRTELNSEQQEILIQALVKQFALRLINREHIEQLPEEVQMLMAIAPEKKLFIAVQLQHYLQSSRDLNHVNGVFDKIPGVQSILQSPLLKETRTGAESHSNVEFDMESFLQKYQLGSVQKVIAQFSPRDILSAKKESSELSTHDSVLEELTTIHLDRADRERVYSLSALALASEAINQKSLKYEFIGQMIQYRQFRDAALVARATSDNLLLFNVGLLALTDYLYSAVLDAGIDHKEFAHGHSYDQLDLSLYTLSLVQGEKAAYAKQLLQDFAVVLKNTKHGILNRLDQLENISSRLLYDDIIQKLVLRKSTEATDLSHLIGQNSEFYADLVNWIISKPKSEKVSLQSESIRRDIHAGDWFSAAQLAETDSESFFDLVNIYVKEAQYNNVIQLMVIYAATQARGD